MLPSVVKILGTSLKAFVKLTLNTVIAGNLQPCFEKSKEISRKVCGMRPIFQRSSVGEGNVNTRALDRGNEGFFNGNDMVLFLACAKIGRNLKYWKGRKE